MNAPVPHLISTQKLSAVQAWAARGWAAPSPDFIKREGLLRNGWPSARWVRDCVCADDLRCFRFDDPVYAEFPSLAWLVQRAEDKGLTGHTEHDTVVARRGT